MCSKPLVMMTELELPFSFAADELFVLINSKNNERFPKSVLNVSASASWLRKNCIMENKNQHHNEFLSSLVK